VKLLKKDFGGTSKNYQMGVGIGQALALARCTRKELERVATEC
jgi:hypothetical protein